MIMLQDRLQHMHHDLRARVYAQLGENSYAHLRSFERGGNSAARTRRRELARQRARRHMRAWHDRLATIGHNPPGNRSRGGTNDEYPENHWTNDIRTGHERRMVLASMAAKLIPAMTIAVKIIRGAPPTQQTVPWRYAHRLRVSDGGDGLIIIDDSSTHVTVQVHHTHNGYRMDAVTFRVAAPAPGMPHRAARLVVFYNARGHASFDTLYVAEHAEGLQHANVWESSVQLHRYLEIAGHLALRRAKQIVDAEAATSTSPTTRRARTVAGILGSRRF